MGLDSLISGFGNADVHGDNLPASFCGRHGDMDRFLFPQGDGQIGVEKLPGDLPAVSRKAAGQIHRYLHCSAPVRLGQNSQSGASDGAVKAGAEDAVKDKIPFPNGLVGEVLLFLGVQHPNFAAVQSLEVFLAFRSGRHSLAEDHRYLCPSLEQLSGDDIAVSPVVSTAGEDHHLLADQEVPLHQQVGGGAPGLFHQLKVGTAQFHRFFLQPLHLFYCDYHGICLLL